MTRSVQAHDHLGQRFGALVVTSRAQSENRDVRWECLCDCGNAVETFGASLRNGRTKSCGCKRPTLAERLQKHSIPEPNSGCILWFGAATKEGYGRIGVGPRIELATHMALQLAGRPVPKGMFACHHCDVPACINPDHLYVGTRQQNINDMVARGRGGGVCFKGRAA